MKLLLFLFPFFCFLVSGPSQDNTEPVVSYKKIGKIKTRTTHEIEASTWSVGGETMDRDYTVYKNWSPYLEELGIKKVRLQGGWAKCEKVKGVYSWEWLDEPVFDLPTKSIEPWICLSYGNPLYGKGDVVLGSRIDTDEVTRKAWLDWVEAIVTRYKDVVNVWEVWNEPNGHNPPEVYADLLMKTAERIKSIQPGSKVIGFALAGIPHDWAESVLQRLSEENKVNLVDYLSYHPYTFNPDDSYAAVAKLHDIMKKYAPEMELLQGENGAPSEYRITKALNKYEWTELTQAKWVLRRMLGDLGRDIPSSVFSVVDLKYPDEMNRKGLLYANDDKTVKHQKQAYFAVQNAAAVFDNSLERVKDFNYEINTTHSVSAFAYRHKFNRNALVCLWIHTNRPSDYNAATPVDVVFEDITFKDPVWVDIRTGSVYEIPEKAWKQTNKDFIVKAFPVYDSPVVIAEKDILNQQ